MSENSKCLILPEDFDRFNGVPTTPAQPDPARPARPPFAGWTFGTFVDACRRLGLREQDPLSGIEFGVHATGTRCLSVEQDEHGAVIREKL